jgi:hypothetical protein
MWNSENERLGLKKHCPAAYVLISGGHIVAIMATLITLFLGLFVLWNIFDNGFSTRDLIVLLPAFAGAAGVACVRIGWSRAKKKGFSYDYASDKVTYSASQEL